MKAVGEGAGRLPAQENLGSGLRLSAWHLCRLALHALALLLLPGMDGQPSLSCTLDFRMQGQLCFHRALSCERLETDTQRGSVAPFPGPALCWLSVLGRWCVGVSQGEALLGASSSSFSFLTPNKQLCLPSSRRPEGRQPGSWAQGNASERRVPPGALAGSEGWVYMLGGWQGGDGEGCEACCGPWQLGRMVPLRLPLRLGKSHSGRFRNF